MYTYPHILGVLGLGVLLSSPPQHTHTNTYKITPPPPINPPSSSGGGPSRVRSAAALVDAGIAVMGHCGLLPQSISALGGFRPQGQHAHSALQVLQQAKVGVIVGGGGV